MLGRFTQRRGDTMIEVMLSVAIFSVVAIMGLTIMNQGSTAAQRSLEITLVRQEMDAQIEALRFMYDAAVAQKTAPGFNASAVAAGSPAAKWNAVLGYRWVAGNSATEFSSMTTGIQCKTPAAIRSERSAGATTGDIFVINTRTATAVPYAASSWGVTPLYSRVLYDNSNNISRVEGIWIEGVRVNARTEAATGIRTPGYTDFHVRACWSTVGQAPPITLGTIVRLYEP